jgi:endothelin-converting enzyme/putative endopeptidase
MKPVLAALMALLLPLAAIAADAASEETPLTALPYSPSLDLSSLDRSADPCNDLYQFACGGWEKNNPIPADQSSWSVYGKLTNDNQRFLWGILDDLANKSVGLSAPQQKIGDYFAACMDEAAIEKLDAKSLAPQLAALAALKDKAALASLLAQEHLRFGPRSLLFTFSSSQDFENSQSVIAFADAGGLGLPDRDYYVKTDKKSVELRAKYLQHVQHMLVLAGDAPKLAQQEAMQIMAIETALAKASLTRVEQRDPRKLLHKVDLAGLRKLTPAFDWDAYLSGIGVKGLDTFNVTQPNFYAALDQQLKTRSLPQLKTYLRWHLIHDNAPYLSSRFVDENFDFYSKTLRGTQKLKARWKRCVALVDDQFGDALGQEFVSRTFTPEMKAKTVEMTKHIEDAMADELRDLDWMSAPTKARALEKLHSMVNKVGYPDRWRDYSTVEVRRDDFLGNVLRANVFESQRQLAKIGKPLDRGEWGMTPPTVNAYYDPQMNDINFPAGVLQPPLYDVKLDDAPNYGNTGSTIGHELTHGFDDEGRQFDDKGNLKDWWSKPDTDAFEQRATCVTDQYAKYVVIDDIHINSKLTEGEDIADLGGTVLAYIAWKAATQDQVLKDQDGFTPDQRFFIGLAQWACGHTRPEALRERALTDPHSPGRFRINGVVVNLPEYGKAFSCPAASAMVSAKPCRIW